MNKILLFIHYWTRNVVDLRRLILCVPLYAGYLFDLLGYSRMKEAEKLNLLDTVPCIFDKTQTTPFDRHYFYQDNWAFSLIKKSGVEHHVDVGSNIFFVSLLSWVTKVTFIDLRPLDAKLENLESKKGSILKMPFPDGSLQSVSCLHVAEHIGLGRYGDPLDPQGTRKAAKELARVLAPGGWLYFSLPVGKPRLCFNAHRIHSSGQIISYFPGLELVGFSAVDDSGEFHRKISLEELENAEYACGMFCFRKPPKG